jgi:hypothetical protein
MPRARSLDDARAVFSLKANGLTDREVSRDTGVPITTIRAWRNGRLLAYARPSPIAPGAFRADRFQMDEFSSLPKEDYAYLLGVYPGDGCLTRNRSSWSLRIVVDQVYPGIIN